MPRGTGWATIAPAHTKKTQKCEETHEQTVRIQLRLGGRRRGRADDLRRHRLDAVAGGVPAADLGHGWSRTGISAAATIDFLGMGFAALLLGRAVGPVRRAHRGARRQRAARPRPGAGEPGRQPAGVPAPVRHPVGVAAGAFYAPMMARRHAAGSNTNRSLAVALVSAGMGMAPLTMAPFARWLITAYDWRTAMLVVGIGAWALVIPAALLVRPPPAAARHRPPARRRRRPRRSS